MSRLQWTFLALVAAQAVHSLEEYVGQLWHVFPPARMLTGLVSGNPETGFVIINATVIAFGFWCFLWPVRCRWPAAIPLAWCWVVVELVNGVGHPLWSLGQRAYTPGVATAPLLLVLAAFLAWQLISEKAVSASAN